MSHRFQKQLLAAFVTTLVANAAQAAPLSDDLKIVAGKSLGAITIGESASDVKQALGKPDREAPGNWVEYNKNGEKLDVFFIDNAVSEIRFNSKKFKTDGGLSLANCADKRWRDQCDYARMQTTFMNTRMCLKKGGLAIYRMDIDGTKDHPLQTAGLIYATEGPVHQPRQFMGEPDGGWEEWDGTGATLFEEFKSPLARARKGIDSGMMP
ncbi:MAG TPA: hypothetical protein V6C81_09820 [Planktothrix sp.]